nr:MAG TPA: hypothetical protein [Caudoviricetes sp.]
MELNFAFLFFFFSVNLCFLIRYKGRIFLSFKGDKNKSKKSKKVKEPGGILPCCSFYSFTFKTLSQSIRGDFVILWADRKHCNI